LRWHGGEVWMNGVDDWRFGEIQTGVMDKYFKNIWTYKIKEMVLCEKGFQQLVSPSSHYRAVPKEILGKLAYYIYHDCVAMMTWEPSMRLIITRNATIAGHFRNQFRSVWENADPLPFTRFLAKDENNDTPWSMNRAEAVRKKIKKIGY
jgi:hypothetical protein